MLITRYSYNATYFIVLSLETCWVGCGINVYCFQGLADVGKLLFNNILQYRYDYQIWIQYIYISLFKYMQTFYEFREHRHVVYLISRFRQRLLVSIEQMSCTKTNLCHFNYRKTSNIRRTLLGNKIVDHSDVVGASPVGAAPTTSSFLTSHLASRDSAKTAARQYENLMSVGIWCVLY